MSETTTRRTFLGAGRARTLGPTISNFLPNRDEVKRITDLVLSLSPSKQTVVTFRRAYSTNLRAAFNAITTSGSSYDTAVTVALVIDNKLGSATADQLSEAALKKAIKEAEENARSEWFSALLPEDRDPLPGPQDYLPINAFFEPTARATPEGRAERARRVLAVSQSKGLIAASYMTTSASVVALANSAGLFAYHASTDSTISMTFRTKDGTGSGWAATNARNFEELDVESAARIAADKAVRSMSPRELPPGDYTVIMEPDAFADMGPNLGQILSGRRGGGGGTFGPDASLIPAERVEIGKPATNPLYTLRSDPAHARLLGAPFGVAGGGGGFGGGFGGGGLGAALLTAGLPNKKVTWVEKGIVKNLVVTMRQARRENREFTGNPTSIIVEGGDGTLDELIRKTDRAVLITHFWYIRALNPVLGTSTGLTRDGLFVVENGEIKYPIKNFRFNESWRTVVQNTEAMTAPYKRVGGSLYPAVRTRAFTFSSGSDAVE
jgi:predicted Zn-dependent protease